MALTGTHTYVGFGFGPIQAGLFLYEAFKSDNFGRLVVAEVLPEVVREIRSAGGFYRLNIAHADRIETVKLGPVGIYDPAVADDRTQLVAAIAEAHEIGTALPSVGLYATEGPASPHRVLAEGLARGESRAVVYAAENHNAAAEMLERAVRAELAEEHRGAVRKNVRFLNTVIGKMSGFAPDPGEAGLAPVTPGSPRAFLVEAFNRILISRIRFDAPFQRGIEVFTEKDDLLPFEEAKLFGHNATHALAAYLAARLGIRTIAELRDVPGFVPFLRDAFLEESGAALIRKNAGVDPLFTADGYRGYADDLLARMTNRFLTDTVERVGRDPERKLGWNDRLVGTMRLARSQGIEPRRYAIGAAAALQALDNGFVGGRVSAADLAGPIWEPATPATAEREAVLAFIEGGRRFLGEWLGGGLGNLRELFKPVGPRRAPS